MSRCVRRSPVDNALEKAPALDPDYSAAHALLAWAHDLCFTRAGFEEAHRRAAVAHERAAIEQEMDHPTALAIGGFVPAFLAVDRDLGLAAIARAAIINPASATVAYLSAQANAISCRSDAAGAYARERSALYQDLIYQDSMIGTDHRLVAEARMRARAVARN